MSHQMKRGLTGLTPFHDQGYSGSLNWFSETHDVGIAPAVLARSGLLSQLDKFMNVYVGTRFDAAEGALAWGQPDADGLKGVLSAGALVLFIPLQRDTRAGWQSIYEFGKDALLNSNSTVKPESDQQSEHSHSLIAVDIEEAVDKSAVLFQVTPLGAIWISTESPQTGPDVRPLLEASQQEIATSHREYREENRHAISNTTEGRESNPTSIRPENCPIPLKPMRQLLAEHEEYTD
ncbi:hypothetical protein [Halorubrum coriense]|uniref:hypothetical protein n=1 Tax=Halorubrum coriense TaxID=64713 RepID=UPI001268F0D1|nr:hypothetical protein [Halorubrum coriense]